MKIFTHNKEEDDTKILKKTLYEMKYFQCNNIMHLVYLNGNCTLNRRIYPDSDLGEIKL